MLEVGFVITKCEGEDFQFEIIRTEEAINCKVVLEMQVANEVTVLARSKFKWFGKAHGSMVQVHGSHSRQEPSWHCCSKCSGTLVIVTYSDIRSKA